MGQAGENLIKNDTEVAYERAVNEFLDKDKECKELIEKFVSGKILFECVPTEQYSDMGAFITKMVEKFNSFQSYLKSVIESRNSALKDVSITLRAAMTLKEGQKRGADGKASMLKYGPFLVTSKTYRSFKADVLFEEVQKQGLYTSLLNLKTIDKNSGEQVPVVTQEIKVLFEPAKNWLREQNLEGIIEAALVEEEGTPAVSGPKPISYIGEVIKEK